MSALQWGADCVLPGRRSGGGAAHDGVHLHYGGDVPLLGVDMAIGGSLRGAGDTRCPGASPYKDKKIMRLNAAKKCW
jgi:hypothetical protein